MGRPVTYQWTPDPDPAEIAERAEKIKAENLAAMRDDAPRPSRPARPRTILRPGTREARSKEATATVRRAVLAIRAEGGKITVAGVARRSGVSPTTVAHRAKVLRMEGVWPM